MPPKTGNQLDLTSKPSSLPDLESGLPAAVSTPAVETPVAVEKTDFVGAHDSLTKVVEGQNLPSLIPAPETPLKNNPESQAQLRSRRDLQAIVTAYMLQANFFPRREDPWTYERIGDPEYKITARLAGWYKKSDGEKIKAQALEANGESEDFANLPDVIFYDDLQPRGALFINRSGEVPRYVFVNGPQWKGPEKTQKYFPSSSVEKNTEKSSEKPPQSGRIVLHPPSSGMSRDIEEIGEENEAAEPTDSKPKKVPVRRREEAPSGASRQESHLTYELSALFSKIPLKIDCLVIELPRAPYFASRLDLFRDRVIPPPSLQNLQIRFPDGTTFLYLNNYGADRHWKMVPPSMADQLEARTREVYSVVRTRREILKSVVAGMDHEESSLDTDENDEDLEAPSQKEKLGTAFSKIPHLDPSQFNHYSQFATAFLEQSGMTFPEMRNRIQKLLGYSIHFKPLSHAFKNTGSHMDFRTVRCLAALFGITEKELIVLLNKRFSEFQPTDWTSDSYPLYIENDYDLEILRFFKKKDPQHQSVGWLAYAGRKKPDRYHSITQLAAYPALRMGAISRIERNTTPLYAHQIEGLSAALNIPAEALVDANNRTFFERPLSTLIPQDQILPNQRRFKTKIALDLTRKLFPDIPHLFISPLEGYDLRRILEYAANPGTIGQHFFAFRKRQPDLLSTAAISENILGKFREYWRALECNEVQPTRQNLPTLIHIFHKLGLPMAQLLPFYKNLTEQSPAFLVAEAMGDDTREGIAARAGINHNTLDRILYGDDDHPVAPETILNLKRALPSLKSGLLYRATQPSIRTQLPETNATEPVIYGDEALFREAFEEFNLSEFLVEVRLNRGLSTVQLGKLLGISQPRARVLQIISTSIQNEKLLEKLSKLLAEKIFKKAQAEGKKRDSRDCLERARHIIYYHFRPQVLLVFPIYDTERKTFIQLDERRFDGFLKTRDLGNRMAHLKTLIRAAVINRVLEQNKKIKESEIEEKELRSFVREELAISEAKAALLLSPAEEITQEDMPALKKWLPEIPAIKWLEGARGPVLANLLGKNPDGTIDYSPPKSISWAWLEDSQAMGQLIQERAQDKYGSLEKASKVLGLPFLNHEKRLAFTLTERKIDDLALVRLADGLDLDRRLLTFFFHIADLKEALAGERHDPIQAFIEKSPETPQTLIQAALQRNPGITAKLPPSTRDLVRKFIRSTETRQLYPEVIDSLARQIPALDGGRLYRAVYPRVTEFLPETGTDTPQIHTDSVLLEKAFRQFDLGKLLFSYRMERDWTVSDMARHLDITDQPTVAYETTDPAVDDENVLLKIAAIVAEQLLYVSEENQPAAREYRFLSPSGLSKQDQKKFKEELLPLARRMVYLHFRPQVLQIFNRKHDGKILPPLKPTEAEVLIASKGAVFNKPLFREELKYAVLMKLEKGKPQPKAATEFAELLMTQTFEAFNRRKAAGLFYEAIPFFMPDVDILEKHYPELSVKSGYEYIHHASLSYFLGHNDDGTINYTLPEGFDWSQIESTEAMGSFLVKAMMDKFGNREKASEKLHVRDLAYDGKEFRKFLQKEDVQEVVIARLSRMLDLDRRLLFFFFKRAELRKVLGVPDPANVTPLQAKSQSAPESGSIRLRPIAASMVRRSKDKDFDDDKEERKPITKNHLHHSNGDESSSGLSKRDMKLLYELTEVFSTLNHHLDCLVVNVTLPEYAGRLEFFKVRAGVPYFLRNFQLRFPDGSAFLYLNNHSGDKEWKEIPRERAAELEERTHQVYPDKKRKRATIGKAAAKVKTSLNIPAIASGKFVHVTEPTHSSDRGRNLEGTIKPFTDTSTPTRESPESNHPILPGAIPLKKDDGFQLSSEDKEAINGLQGAFSRLPVGFNAVIIYGDKMDLKPGLEARLRSISIPRYVWDFVLHFPDGTSLWAERILTRKNEFIRYFSLDTTTTVEAEKKILSRYPPHAYYMTRLTEIMAHRDPKQARELTSLPPNANKNRKRKSSVGIKDVLMTMKKGNEEVRTARIKAAMEAKKNAPAGHDLHTHLKDLIAQIPDPDSFAPAEKRNDPQWISAAPLQKLFLNKLRASGVNQTAFAKYFTAETGIPLSERAMTHYVKGEWTKPPFELLQPLGFFLGLSPHQLISLLNTQNHPDIESRHWRTRTYPIYMEHSADLERIRHHAVHDPDHQSLGWLLYSKRKNPKNYSSIQEMETNHRISMNTIGNLEFNELNPSAPLLLKIAKVYGIGRTALIEALTRTFHSKGADSGPGKSIHQTLSELFPGQPIYLEPHTNDAEKVARYEKKPGTIAQYFFSYRKTLPNLPSSKQLSLRLGFNTTNVWEDIENNERPVNLHSMNFWKEILDKIGKPLSVLDPYMKEAGVDTEGHQYGIAKMLAGKRDVKGANIGKATIHRIVYATGSTTHRTSTIANAAKKSKLDTPDALRLLAINHPQAADCFPELTEDPPRLVISPEVLNEAAAHFHFGDLFLSFRMERNLDRITFAEKYLGKTKQTVEIAEKAILTVENDETILRIAALLAEKIFTEDLRAAQILPEAFKDRQFVSLSEVEGNVDGSSDLFKKALDRAKRIVYLHCRPHIIGLGVIHDGPDGNAHLPDADLAEKLKHAMYTYPGRGSIRQQLQKDAYAWAKQKASTLKIPAPDNLKALARFIAAHGEIPGLNERTAFKLLYPAYTVSMDDFKLIKPLFPLPEKECFESVHFAELTYFLGRNTDTSVNYDLPAGWNWGKITSDQVILDLIESKIQKNYGGDSRAAADAAGIQSLVQKHKLKEMLRGEKTDLTAIAALAHGLKIDKKILYVFFRKNILKPFVNSGTPHFARSNHLSGGNIQQETTRMQPSSMPPARRVIQTTTKAFSALEIGENRQKTPGPHHYLTTLSRLGFNRFVGEVRAGRVRLRPADIRQVSCLASRRDFRGLHQFIAQHQRGKVGAWSQAPDQWSQLASSPLRSGIMRSILVR